jgi:L-fucose isomerase-like protein
MATNIVVVPFAYADYPRAVVETQVRQSQRLLASLEPLFVPTVFGREDALRAAAQVHEANPALVVALLASWIEAPNLFDALQEQFGKPLVLWSHTVIEHQGRKQTLGAFVAAGVAKQSLADFGVPFDFIYGTPLDESIRERIELLARVAGAVRRLRRSRIGLFGYPALGMYTATVDHVQLRKQFGPELVHFDEYQIIRGLDGIHEDEARGALGELESSARMGEGVTKEDLLPSARMVVVLRQLIERHSLDAVTVKCQYELSQQYGYTPCVALSLLGNQLPVGCEADILTILTELVLHLLSGRAVSYTDIHEVGADRILAAACGFAPFSLAAQEAREVNRWGWEAFRGVLNSSPCREGAVTLARFARDGAGFKLHCATGSSVGKSDWNEVGCPAFPGMDIVLDGDTGRFAAELASNHYALVYGDLRRGLELFCAKTGVRFIYT